MVSWLLMPQREPNLFQALLPIAVLITLLILNVNYFGDHTLDGANQFVLILASAVAGLVAIRLGASWSHIRDSMVKSISSAMPSILILLMIGALAGTWLLSGVIPTLIYYGLQVFHPKIFLFATVVIAGMVSLATGSSWSTVATVGIALIGVGQAWFRRDPEGARAWLAESELPEGIRTAIQHPPELKRKRSSGKPKAPTDTSISAWLSGMSTRPARVG